MSVIDLLLENDYNLVRENEMHKLIGQSNGYWNGEFQYRRWAHP